MTPGGFGEATPDTLTPAEAKVLHSLNVQAAFVLWGMGAASAADVSAVLAAAPRVVATSNCRNCGAPPSAGVGACRYCGTAHVVLTPTMSTYLVTDDYTDIQPPLEV